MLNTDADEVVDVDTIAVDSRTLTGSDSVNMLEWFAVCVVERNDVSR